MSTLESCVVKKIMPYVRILYMSVEEVQTALAALKIEYTITSVCESGMAYVEYYRFVATKDETNLNLAFVELLEYVDRTGARNHDNNS